MIRKNCCRYRKLVCSAILICFSLNFAVAGSRRPATMEAPVPEEMVEIQTGGDKIGEHYIIEAPEVEPQATNFFEVWAYLVAENEDYLKPEYPITDIGYFSAELNTYGELIGVPNPKKLAGYQGRVHLVVACNSTSLTHFALAPDGAVRGKLIDDLVAATEKFDGLQIDFELVPKRDVETFASFIKELRQRLPHKLLSVALPARIRTLENDVYDYKRLSQWVDKVFVMAYDEHWSSSKPGPVASIDWCNKIVKHALDTISRDKLVMGLPFYGRTWDDVSLDRAFYFSGIQRIMRENSVTSEQITRENHIPTFSYIIPEVRVTGYYDDVHSLTLRLDNYFDSGIKAVGFWCLGQEDPRIWNHISISQQEQVTP